MGVQVRQANGGNLGHRDGDNTRYFVTVNYVLFRIAPTRSVSPASEEERAPKS